MEEDFTNNRLPMETLQGKEEASSPNKPDAKNDAGSAPAWLSDVDRAAQHLTRLSLESAAQAALIVHEGKLWAYAGELPQPAAEELARLVAHLWERDGGSDLARFVRLEANNGDYMLYATGLEWDSILALVFDAETPFSKIRSQAGRLARALSAPSGSEADTPEKGSMPSPGTGAGRPLEEPDPLANLPPLFEDIPPPTPSGWYTEVDMPDDNEGSQEQPAEASEPGEAGQDPRPSAVEKNLQNQQPEPFLNLQPVTSSVYQINYACMLAPRLPDHHLTGDLAAALSSWMPRLCLSFGWRLIHLSIRPDHLSWIVDVSPSTSPGRIMRILRKHTSERIFADFPRLAKENPSGDFWAPGYLIMSSSRPLPTQVVHEFIRQTRSRQGVPQAAAAAQPGE